MQIENIEDKTALVNRLEYDIRLKMACGFKYGSAIPSISTFCRAFNSLAETDILTDIYNQLIDEAIELDMVDSESIAIDSTKIESYDSPKSNKQIDKSDPNRADWGAKYDQHKNLIRWFGFKLHLACDTKGEIPLAFSLKPANESDSKNALPLVDQSYKLFTKKPLYYLMDKGYDVTKIYKKIHEEYEAQAIIPLNLRNAKVPPPGFIDFDMTPECSGGHEMIYWGHDDKYNKFRCPHATGNINCCHGQSWCSSSNYGLVVKTKPSDNYRGISLPHRNSRGWKQIYNRRTSVERVFSYLKEIFNIKDPTVRGRLKTKVHIQLNLIAYLASKIAVKKSQINSTIAA